MKQTVLRQYLDAVEEAESSDEAGDAADIFGEILGPDTYAERGVVRISEAFYRRLRDLVLYADTVEGEALSIAPTTSLLVRE